MLKTFAISFVRFTKLPNGGTIRSDIRLEVRDTDKNSAILNATASLGSTDFMPVAIFEFSNFSS